MNKPTRTLQLDIKLHSTVKPDREISPVALVGTLEELITIAFRARFPEYQIEINKLEADWPGAEDDFPKFDRKKC